MTPACPASDGVEGLSVKYIIPELLEHCEIDTAGHDLVTAGSGRTSGEWTSGGDAAGGNTGESNAGGGASDQDDNAVVPVAAVAPTDKDPFFDTLYPLVHLAQKLGIDETWPLGLAAYESGWLGPHARDINDPFGVTHGGGPDVRYDSLEAAIDAWKRRYGHMVQGATSAADFVRRLLLVGRYNSATKGWAAEVLGSIRSVRHRLDSWKSRHNL